MKRLLCVLLAVSTILLTGCDADSPGPATSEQAQEYLDSVESQMRQKYNDDYFKSEQWKAFVDNYWQSFKEAQEANQKYLISSSEE